MFEFFKAFLIRKEYIPPKFHVGDTVQISMKAPKKYRKMKTIIKAVFSYRYHDGSYENKYKTSITDSYFFWPEDLLEKVE